MQGMKPLFCIGFLSVITVWEFWNILIEEVSVFSFAVLNDALPFWQRFCYAFSVNSLLTFVRQWWKLSFSSVYFFFLSLLIDLFLSLSWKPCSGTTFPKAMTQGFRQLKNCNIVLYSSIASNSTISCCMEMNSVHLSCWTYACLKPSASYSIVCIM